MIKGKRYFSKTEIVKWNDILTKRNYKYAIGENSDSKLVFINKWSDGYDVSIDRFMNPEWSFRYNFSFSVIKNRKDDFYKILDEFIESGFEIGHDLSRLLNIKEEVYKCVVKEHKIYNNEFFRMEYVWHNPLVSMIVSTIIEDAISFFEMIWGYEEDGEEKCILKYPTGSIVSIKDTKDIDYMVSGYEFFRKDSINNGNNGIPFCEINTILYNIVCIESDIKSPIIRYGDCYTVHEDDICPSRTNNLNIILN